MVLRFCPLAYERTESKSSDIDYFYICSDEYRFVAFTGNRLGSLGKSYSARIAAAEAQIYGTNAIADLLPCFVELIDRAFP